MALRVWLPLNGNFKNQGTSLFTSPSLPSGASWGDGKLGKGLVINNAGSSSGEISDLAGLQKFTICFWYKIPSGKTFTQWSDLVYNNASSVLRLEVSNTSGTSTNWFGFGMDAGGLSGQTVTLDTWYHEAITVDGTLLTRYVNGVQKGQKTAGSQATLGNTIKLGDTGMYCTLCDLRIYDECLSPKQIHEISKGLIAHYKLEGIGANPNLFKNTLNATHSSSGAVTGSSSSANFSLDSTATVANLAGKQVTISVDIDAVNVVANEESGNHRAGTEIAFSRSGGGATYLGAWQTFTDTASTVRKKLVATGTIPSDWTGGLTERNMYIQRLASGTVKLSNLKIEIGGVATDWTPSVDDAIYSKLGFDNMLLTDVSGNGYDLLNVDSTMTYNTSSPRYNTSIYRASATRSVGNIPPIFQSGQEINEITLSGWLKTNTTLGTNKNLICLGNNSFIRFGPTNNNTLWTYVRMGDTNKTLEVTSVNARDDIWHNYVVTFKNGVITAYMDGVQKGTADYSSTATTLSCQSTANYIGAYNSTSEIVLGSFSDIRIYATALSAADVKQLYDTAGIVDNANNEYVYEYKENGKLLDYADYPGAQTNLTAVFTRTVVDEPEAPTGKAVKLECTTAGSGYYFSNAPWSTAKAKMENGKTYVVSMYVKTNASRSIKMNVECASSQSQTTWTVGTEYQHLVNTFVYSNTTQYSALTDYANFVVGDVIYIHSFKIEAVEDQPKLEKTGVMDASTMDENDIAKIYKSKLEANDFIEI